MIFSDGLKCVGRTGGVYKGQMEALVQQWISIFDDDAGLQFWAANCEVFRQIRRRLFYNLELLLTHFFNNFEITVKFPIFNLYFSSTTNYFIPIF